MSSSSAPHEQGTTLWCVGAATAGPGPPAVGPHCTAVCRSRERGERRFETRRERGRESGTHCTAVCRSRERGERRFEIRRERGRESGTHCTAVCRSRERGREGLKQEGREGERVAHTVQLCAVLERGGEKV